MKAFFRVALLLLGVSFLAENLGFMTHQLCRMLGMVCLGFYGLSIFPFGRRAERKGLQFTGYVLLVLSVLFFSGPILSRIAGTGVYLFSLGLLLKSRDTEDGEIQLLFHTVTIYFALLLLYFYSPHVWYVVNESALWFSGFASRIAGAPLLFSSTYMGLPITVLFFIFILVSFFCTGKKRPGLFMLSAISLIIMSWCYLILMGALPAVGKAVMDFFSDDNNFLRLFLGFLFEKDYPLVKYNYQMNSPVVLFFLCLISLLLILRGRDIDKISIAAKQGGLKRTFAFLLITAIAVFTLVVELSGPISEKKKVVLYNKGFLNWKVPDFTMFGSKSAGMFGNLPVFLNAMGFSAERVDTVSKEVLDDAKVLMMINLDKEVPRNEREAVWDFVEKGGSLLLLGDHTFYKHGVKRIILNDILEPYSIRYKFDSADWFVGGWLHSYQYAGHPVTAGMRDDMNDAGSVIGASLSVTPPAFPLVIGKHGYSDPGNDAAGGNRGFLGNLNYDPGEPLGDVVLVGAQHYGRGKVMVFGDTSAFANAILVNSHGFVNRVFTWLARDESPKRYGTASLIAIIFLIAAFFIYMKNIQKPLLLLFFLILSLIIIKAGDYLKQRNSQTDFRGNIAYVDASHGERFSPEAWNENAIMGLHLNLMRNGYLSFSMRTFEKKKLQQAKLLVLIAPSAPFTKKEIGGIRDFVSKGGTLILTVGWEERQASVPLMESFGFSIEHLPLAQFISIIGYANQKVRFYESWPVVSSGDKGQVVASFREYPVVVKKPYGQGHVVMIGDSCFFWNKNLEMEESRTQENVQFLKWLLDNMQAGKGGKP